MKRIHFIAIGGSAMHNLAIALKQQGYDVTGSDDDIFEPSRSRLEENGLLPVTPGWYPEKISVDIDLIILGMHARDDNPELIKASALGIQVVSFPEFIYQHSLNKKRVVIAGSHGKSTITSILLYVLNRLEKDFDYLVGAGLPGFKNMVRLSDSAPTIILEGDEYFSSATDKTPKFLRYNHNVGLISGIAWDHINAFPSREIYEEQFLRFIKNTPGDGILIFNQSDPVVKRLIDISRTSCSLIPYDVFPYHVEKGVFNLDYKGSPVPLKIFGHHNMQNIDGALKVLECLGIDQDQSVGALSSFPGADNRLEIIATNANYTLFRDFAHAPSKVKASVQAVKELNPERSLAAFLELHTYSSLNPSFLPEYKGTMASADLRYVFINDHALKIKKMAPVSNAMIRDQFGDQEIVILRSAGELKEIMLKLNYNNLNLLFMSSGNFDGLDLKEFVGKLN